MPVIDLWSNRQEEIGRWKRRLAFNVPLCRCPNPLCRVLPPAIWGENKDWSNAWAKHKSVCVSICMSQFPAMVLWDKYIYAEMWSSGFHNLAVKAHHFSQQEETIIRCPLHARVCRRDACCAFGRSLGQSQRGKSGWQRLSGNTCWNTCRAIRTIFMFYVSHVAESWTRRAPLWWRHLSSSHNGGLRDVARGIDKMWAAKGTESPCGVAESRRGQGSPLKVDCWKQSALMIIYDKPRKTKRTNVGYIKYTSVCCNVLYRQRQ